MCVSASASACGANIIEADDDLLTTNSAKTFPLQTPTLSKKERGEGGINQAYSGMDNKFAAYTVYGNLIRLVPTSMEK